MIRVCATLSYPNGRGVTSPLVQYSPAGTSNQQLTADSLIHRARILYIIATSFHLPPRSLSILRQSLALYTTALQTATAPLRQIDAGFNLAVGLAQLADWQEEGLENVGAEEVRSLRERAVGLLMDVAGAQEAYLAENEGEKGDEGDDGVAGNVDESEDDNDETTTYEEHVPTPSALVETLFEIIDITTLIWATLPTLDSLPPHMAPQAIDELLQRSMQIATASNDVSLAGSVHVKRLDVALTLAKTTGIELPLSDVRNVWQTATAKESPIDDETRLACADALVTASAYLAYRALDAQSAWQHLGFATQVATTSLSLPPPLTVSPLASASTLLDLTTLSLRRALVSLRFPDFASSKANGKQLLANAQVYANRGLKDLGWTTLMSEPVNAVAGGASRTLSIGVPSSAAATSLPPVTGWDKESLSRTIVLTLLRTFYYQSTLLSDAEFVTTAQKKAETLLARLQALRRTESQERWIGRRDIQRYVEMLEDEEGVLPQAEAQFWGDFVERLES